MRCNIDAKGKAVRLGMGILLVIAGMAMLLMLLFEIVWSRWQAHGALGLIAIGAFCIFESRAGWCALRAMGIKTRL